VDLRVALICFPVIFVGELPDKTMFASLLMATRGRPWQVWLGAAGAFVAHVAIAVTVGATVFTLLPHRLVEAVVAAVFAFSAAYAWRAGVRSAGQATVREARHHGTVATALVVIFLAEWGDITQILTANLAAHYHSPLSVAVGAVLALWTVAALAVLSGSAVLRRLDVAVVRKITAVALLALAGLSAYSAIN
jgi:putative Ca2+/H+ antiporter (TMEM165/GDT1 family)